MGVLAVLGLLTFGLVSKGEGSLQEGDAVPTTELPTLGQDDDRLDRRLPGQVGAGQRLGVLV